MQIYIRLGIPFGVEFNFENQQNRIWRTLRSHLAATYCEKNLGNLSVERWEVPHAHFIHEITILGLCSTNLLHRMECNILTNSYWCIQGFHLDSYLRWHNKTVFVLAANKYNVFEMAVSLISVDMSYIYWDIGQFNDNTPPKIFLSFYYELKWIFW